MALLAFLVLALFIWLADLNQTAKMKEKYEEMKERGSFDDRDNEREHIIWQDMYSDWYNEKKMFPEEYQAYLRMNKTALRGYVAALTSDQEMKEGLYPMGVIGSYNKYTYDPFKAFHSAYDDLIKIYNETGVLYF